MDLESPGRTFKTSIFLLSCFLDFSLQKKSPQPIRIGLVDEGENLRATLLVTATPALSLSNLAMQQRKMFQGWCMPPKKIGGIKLDDLIFGQSLVMLRDLSLKKVHCLGWLSYNDDAPHPKKKGSPGWTAGFYHGNQITHVSRITRGQNTTTGLSLRQTQQTIHPKWTPQSS